MFPIAVVRQYLQPVSFMNSLETKLWNIAFPLLSSALPGIFDGIWDLPFYPAFVNVARDLSYLAPMLRYCGY